MTNPVSPIPSAQLPLYTTQIVDENGNATALFHRFLVGLQERTGGVQGASVSDASQIAQEALTTATNAGNEAVAAQSTATSAQAAAAAAQASADAAQEAASALSGITTLLKATTLTKTNNLSDVGSVTASRSNLGLATVPLCFAIDAPTNGLKRGMPILQSMSIAANFAGTKVWWGVNATADAVFTLQRYRGGSYTPLGTVTFVNHGAGSVLSIQPSSSLAVGDVLVLQCPSVADATLAEIAITFSATLT